MGIRFACPHCQRQLNIKSFLAGKRGFCPHCSKKIRIPEEPEELQETPDEINIAAQQKPVRQGAVQFRAAPAEDDEAELARAAARAEQVPLRLDEDIPVISQGTTVEAAPRRASSGSDAPPTGPPGKTKVGGATRTAHLDPIDEAPGALWYVRPASGGQYGPANGELLRRWIAEGRVPTTSYVWREGWSDWLPASDVLKRIQGGDMATAGNEPGSQAPPAERASGWPFRAAAAAPDVTPSLELPRSTPGAAIKQNRRSKRSWWLIVLGIAVVVVIVVAVVFVFLRR
jgi:hypothetical protein